MVKLGNAPQTSGMHVHIRVNPWFFCRGEHTAVTFFGPFIRHALHAGHLLLHISGGAPVIWDKCAIGFCSDSACALLVIWYYCQIS